MGREDSGYELKSAFDPDSPGAMLELIKDLVALANSGGGTIRIGATETGQSGVSRDIVPYLDGAKVGGKVDQYINPAQARVSHRVTPLKDDKVIIDLHIEAAGRYPFVFSKQGQYLMGKKNVCVFRPGDIYVRRGARSERINYADMVRIIDRAMDGMMAATREDTINTVKSLLGQITRIPSGASPVVLAQAESGDLLGMPGAVIDFAIQRRKNGHPGSVLDARDLLLSFLDRDEFEYTPERLDMLIRSSLRRTPTLYFWLSKISEPSFIENILLSTLHDEDRDKSDAKDNLLEVAALFVDDRVINDIVAGMRQSRYKHFQDAANRWPGRTAVLQEFARKVQATHIHGIPAQQLTLEELLKHAEVIARDLLHQGRSLAKSRLMGDIGRVVFQRHQGSHKNGVI